MFDIENDWMPRQERLVKLIRKPQNFAESINLTLEMHGLLHESAVSGSSSPTLGDEIIKGLEAAHYAIRPRKKDRTITWNLWHVTRIEDLIANVLIMERPQVLNDMWLDRLGTQTRDTANAMTKTEIEVFSREVVPAELNAYRAAVGCKTREMLLALTPDNLSKKPRPESLTRIVEEGGLVPKKDSIWLKDFWGNKTVAGMLLLPITRHQMMHLPNCLELKEIILNR